MENKVMKTIQQWFDEYAESHQNHTNIMLHFICVPLVYFGIVGLLVSIPTDFLHLYFQDDPPFYYNFGTLALIITLIFYLRLSFSIFCGMLVFSTIVMTGNYFLSTIDDVPLWLISMIILTTALTGQFYGYKVEGKNPAFFNNILFFFIGPAWILSSIYNKINLKY
jgi:uncharacterized membrane protein YGL010W